MNVKFNLFDDFKAELLREVILKVEGKVKALKDYDEKKQNEATSELRLNKALS